MDEGFIIPNKEAHTCLEQTRLFIRSLGETDRIYMKYMQRLQTGCWNYCQKSMMTLSLEELLTEKNFGGSFTVVVMLRFQNKMDGIPYSTENY